MWLALSIIFGLCFGSFINAAVWRIYQQSVDRRQKTGKKTKKSNPNLQSTDYSLLTGRSMCPNCHHLLSGRELVPVVSWLILRGRCRWCKRAIAVQYPLVEVATAALFGLSYGAWEFTNLTSKLSFGLWLLILTSLILLAVYDLKHMLLPTRVIKVLIALVWVNLLLVGLSAGDVGLIATHLLAAMAGWAFFYGLYALSGGRWLGGGDVRLSFVMGLLLGPKLLLLALFVGFNSAAIISIALIIFHKLHRKALIPFGPFLIAGTIVAMLWGDSIVETYLRFMAIP